MFSSTGSVSCQQNSAAQQGTEPANRRCQDAVHAASGASLRKLVKGGSKQASSEVNPPGGRGRRLPLPAEATGPAA